MLPRGHFYRQSTELASHNSVRAYALLQFLKRSSRQPWLDAAAGYEKAALLRRPHGVPRGHQHQLRLAERDHMALERLADGALRRQWRFLGARRAVQSAGERECQQQLQMDCRQPARFRGLGDCSTARAAGVGYACFIGVTLAGVRSADEDPVSATFVQPMRGVHFTLLEQFDSFNKMADTTTSTLTSPGCEHVPLSAYNDDYCDCGEDEPHTAACSQQGRSLENSYSFFCVNAGFKGHRLLSSRLGDGICDCCDGSDENGAVGGATCPNTCAALAVAANVEIRQKIESVSSALVTKAQGSAEGRALQAEWVATLPQKQQELETLRLSWGPLKLAYAKLSEEEAAKNVDENKAASLSEAAAAAAALVASTVAATESNTAGESPEVPACEGWNGELKGVPGESVFCDYQDLGEWMTAVVESKSPEDGSFSVVYTEDGELEAGIEPERIRPRQPDCAGKALVALLPSGAAELNSVTLATNFSCDGGVVRASCRAGYENSTSTYICAGDGAWHPARDGPGLECVLQPPLLPVVTAVSQQVEALLVSFAWAASSEAVYEVTATPTSGDAATPAVTVSTKTEAEQGRDSAGPSPFVISRKRGLMQANVSGLVNEVEYSITVHAENGAQGRKQSAKQSYRPTTLKAEWSSSNKAFTTLTKEISSLRRKLALDIGREAEFGSLLDECVQKKEGSFTYRVCGFKDVVQKEGEAIHQLGQWAGWVGGDGGESKETSPDQQQYQAMRYTSGADCGATKDTEKHTVPSTDYATEKREVSIGPVRKRATTVRLSCGLKAELLQVNEPRTCEYEIVMATPYACQETDMPLPYEPAAHTGGVVGGEAGHQEL